MLSNYVRFQHISADQVLLDDGLEHRRVALAVPGAFRIHDRNRTALTDPKAVGLGAENAAPLLQAEFLQAPFEEIPGRQPTFLLAAFRVGLIAAEKDVAARLGDADRLGSLYLGIRQNSVTSTAVPFSTKFSAAAISMYPSACDMLVMSPDDLKAGTASPFTTLTV